MFKNLCLEKYRFEISVYKQIIFVKLTIFILILYINFKN